MVEFEVFKTVTYPGIKPNMYLISSNGTVINDIRDKVKSQHEDIDGYKRVVMMFDNNYKRPIGVHRLVAWEFCKGYSYTNNIVNHKDADIRNNHCENLEWCDTKYNFDHAYDLGLIAVGENSVHNKYSEEMIRFICEQLVLGLQQGEIYKLVTTHYDIENIKKSRIINLIKDLRRRKVWRHVVKDYMY